MLKEGDTVSMGCNPTLKVGNDFLFFKPSAVVTRTLSDDVMGDLKEMQSEVRKQLFRALRCEITGVSDIYEALGSDADLDDLIKLCEKEVGNGEGQITFKVHEGESEPGVEIDGSGNVVPLGDKKGGVTKKGPGKLTKAKPGVTKKKPQG
jgi:hypothetical protein